MAKLDLSNLATGLSAKERMRQAASTGAKGTVTEIPVSKLKESPLNAGMPMEDLEALADSIRERGQQEPLLVYRMQDGTFEIYAGHRRFRAMKDILHKPTCRCIAKEYPADERERFADHFTNNAERRENNFRFWIAEIRSAENVLRNGGFTDSKAELMEEVCRMLGNKISVPQARRYEAVGNMTPEILALGDAGYAVSVLYSAVSLSGKQQKLLAETVFHSMEANNGELISREEFARAVNRIRSTVEIKEEDAQKEKPVRNYFTRTQNYVSRFGKTFGVPRSEKDRLAGLENVRQLHAMCEEWMKQYG